MSIKASTAPGTVTEFKLSIGSDFGGVYVELPLGQYDPEELDTLNIEIEFERELINLLQVISKSKRLANAGSLSSSD